MAKEKEETRIAAENTVRGNLSGSEDVIVAGRIEGTVALAGTLVVEAGGVVKADVEVDRARIFGIVVGDVSARELIVLEAGARVLGDLTAPKIKIVEGARFAGKVDMKDAAETQVAMKPAPRVERAEPTVYVSSSPQPVVSPPPPLSPQVESQQIIPTMTAPVSPPPRKRIIVRRRTAPGE